MVPRKRGRQENEDVELSKEEDTLHRIRNMWQFANLMQWIFIFGRAVKISEDLDIEAIESECLKPCSTVLSALGLALLKFVSSHRGLTPEIFDEYTRKQYIANAPHRNPYGDQEKPARFDDFDVFTKIRVLQQLTQWVMKTPERIREKMDEQKDTEQKIWRIEQFGWDAKDRTYIVLDDNRLYRRSDPEAVPPPAKPKNNSKKTKIARRSSKRTRASDATNLDSKFNNSTDNDIDDVPCADDGLSGMKWECIAISLEEYNTFLESLEKSRDPNEQMLRKRIIDDVIPFLKKQEEARQRKQAQKQRELLNLEKLACAKRSSRIAGRMEKQKLIEEARNAERIKDAELAMATKHQEKWNKTGQEKECRIITREQRLKDREARRILHEKGQTNISDDIDKARAEDDFSERDHKADFPEQKETMKNTTQYDEWIFDCICGAYGKIDDGTHSIACDRCGTWQHSKCVQVSKADADRDDFSFICRICKGRDKDNAGSETRLPIKIKLSCPSLSTPLSDQDLSCRSDCTDSLSKLNSPPNLQTKNSHILSDLFPHKSHTKSLSPDQQNSPRSIELLHTQNEYPFESTSQKLSDIPTPNLLESPKSCSQGCSESNVIPLESTLQPGSNTSTQQVYSKEKLISPPRPSPKTYVFQDNQISRSYIESDQKLSSENRDKNPLNDHDMVSHISNQNHINSRKDIGAVLQSSSSDRYRRSSANLPSPFAGAPKLTPMQKTCATSTFAGSNSPTKISHSPQHHLSTSPPRSSPVIDGINSEYEHALALPPAATGISPTKTSPPRSLALNGGLGPKTPTMLPPVAFLTPSPKTPNLSPPVKSSEPEWSRPAGQIIR